MAQHDSDIANAWVNGETIKKSWLQRLKESSGGHWGANPGHGMWASEGTVRFGPGDNGTELLSYGTWAVAAKVGDTIILNGDDGPTMTTKGHQREVREAVKRAGAKHCILPFSALRAADIQVVGGHRGFRLIAITQDRTVPYTYKDKDGNEVQGERHFLGETLFAVEERRMAPGAAGPRTRFFVCGLDRNDDSRHRHFFLARLPVTKRKLKTVDEALDMLRPKGVPEGSLRQGEWWLLETDKKPKAAEVTKTYVSMPDKVWIPGAKGEREAKPYRGVPVVSDKGADMTVAVQGDLSRKLRGRELRHVATRMYLNGAVYVSGMLRDSEHGPLKLGNGKQWFKVVRNTADGSWGATGEVD